MLDNLGSPPDSIELADRLAILDILAGHSRGLDRLDLDLLRAVYWEDAQVDYGFFKGLAHEFAGLVVGALSGGYELTQHVLGNSLVDLDGDAARVETLVTAWHLEPGAEREMMSTGRYLDKLEKRAGTWKLSHRLVLIDWVRRYDITNEREDEQFDALGKGRHDREDPSYTHFSS